MARSTSTRLVQVYEVADARRAQLGRRALELVGERSHHDQGTLYVAARTKVAAAARLSDVMGMGYTAAMLRVVGSSWPRTLTDLARAGVMENAGGLDGRVVAMRHAGDGNAVLVADGDGGPETLVVAGHWRYANGRLDYVATRVDPVLRPTRPVMVPGPGKREHVGKGYGGERTTYPGGVATFTEHDDVWVAGVGEMPREQAERLMSGLAGALAELDARSTTEEK